MYAKLARQRHRLEVYAEKMKGLSPSEKLNRGYAYIEGRKNAPVKSVREVKKGEILSVYMTDGRIRAKIVEIEEEVYGK